MLEVARDSGKPTASRTVGMFGAIFQYAVKRKMRPDNPVRGVERFADRQRQRRLTDEEYAAIGAAIRGSECLASRTGRGEVSGPDWVAQRRGP